MRKSQKGFANIILIAIVVLLVGALGYVTLVKKSEPIGKEQSSITENTQSVLPTTTVTANIPPQIDVPAGWKTYTNNRFGFELKYPPNVSVTDRPTGVSVANWGIYIFDNPQKLNFDNWFNSYFDKNLNKDCKFYEPTTYLGSYILYQVDSWSLSDSCDNRGEYALSDDNLRIVEPFMGQDPQPEDAFKILSTFKFIPVIK